MSYGMMVHVQLNNQTGFDRIWRWVLTYMYHGDASDPLQGWSAWHCNVDGSRIDQGPALDGETFKRQAFPKHVAGDLMFEAIHALVEITRETGLLISDAA